MADLQFIMRRLNEAPFSMNLVSVVEFDERGPLEPLQVLNDVFASMDANMTADIHYELEEERADRIVKFLLVLKYEDFPPEETERQAWVEALGKGRKSIVYPLLQWALSKYEKLCKRAYLAPFLMPLDLPIEITMVDNTHLNEMAERYRVLQDEFRDVHKHYEATRAVAAQEQYFQLKNKISGLRKVSHQLQARIDSLGEKSVGIPNFEQMLDAVSKLGQEQQEEKYLRTKKEELCQSLAMTEERLNWTRQNLQDLKETSSGQLSAVSLIEKMKRELQDLTKVVRSDMLQEKRKLMQRLDELERDRLEPTRMEEDVETMRQMAAKLEQECKEAKEKIKAIKEQSESGAKLSTLKNEHADLTLAQLASKEAEVEAKENELNLLRTSVQELDLKINNIPDTKHEIVSPDGFVMTNKDLKAFSFKLREAASRYNTAMQVLSEIKDETATLHRTEQILKSRHRNLDEFMKSQEERAGVMGYRETQNTLELTSEESAEVNDVKGQTLEEMSIIVKNIAQTLQEKKEKLQPMIEKLKEARKKHQELQQLHSEKKNEYDALAQTLASNRKGLEDDCNRLKEEWLREERRYHLLRAEEEMVRNNLEKLKMEERWKRGKEKFHPDFACLEDMYEHKITEQAKLEKQLRTEQQLIRENENERVKQKMMYSNLHKLLTLKLKAKQDEMSQHLGENRASIDPTDIGNAQVLVLD